MPRPKSQSLVIGGQPKRGQPAPTDSPRNRFRRVAPARVATAVKAVRHLQQFGNPAVYDVHPNDAEKILKLLREELEHLEFALSHPGKTVPILTFD